MKNKFTIFKGLLHKGCIAVMLLALTAPVFATVIGSHVLNGDGTVTYSYVVNNSGGAFDVAAWSLEFGFATPDWDQADTLSGGAVTVPNADWFASAGIPVTGLSAQDFLSLNPGADVAIGQSLLGFSFTSRFLPGLITYEEFSADGAAFTGQTVGPCRTVPEGVGPFATMAVGAMMVFAFATRKLRAASPFIVQA